VLNPLDAEDSIKVLSSAADHAEYNTNT